MGRSLFATVPLLVALAAAAPCRGQIPGETPPAASATWVDHLNYASVNAILAGLTAGVVGHLRGRSFSRAFARGAMGGGVAYAGKRISASDFGGAGLLGRQVAAVGGSITRNASLGIPALDSLWLPLGPARLAVGTVSWRRPAFRVDLQEAYWIAYGISEERLDLDWGRTLSSGAPVFVTDATLRSDGAVANGLVTGGIIVLSTQSRTELRRVIAHERVHVAQSDFLKTTIGYPLEDWSRDVVGAPRSRWTDPILIGLAELAAYPLAGAWSSPKDLLQAEAEFLEGR